MDEKGKGIEKADSEKTENSIGEADSSSPIDSDREYVSGTTGDSKGGTDSDSKSDSDGETNLGPTKGLVKPF